MNDIIENEIWRPIVGYEDSHEISNLGRIKSLARKDARGWKLREKYLKLFLCSNQYLNVRLGKDGKTQSYLFHRLLAIAFLPNPYNLPQINHKDGNKLNNNLSNLEWCTRQHNLKHAYATGLSDNKHLIGHKWTAGERNGRSKITKKIANQIRYDRQIKKITYKELEKTYHISDTQIAEIIKGNYWK